MIDAELELFKNAKLPAIKLSLARLFERLEGVKGALNHISKLSMPISSRNL